MMATETELKDDYYGHEVGTMHFSGVWDGF